MRIGIVSQAYFPIHGGVTEHVHHTMLELERRGHEVTIITANFNRDDRLYSGPGVRRIGFDVTLPNNGAFVNVTIGWRLTDQLLAIERERRFDIVHIHSPLDPFLPWLAASHMTAVKVGTFHTYMESSWARSVTRQLFLPAFRRLDGKIAVSEAARGFFQLYYPGDYRVIPNGVDMERFRPEEPHVNRHAGGGDFTILFVGRLDPRKGVKYLIQAMPLITAAVPRARLVIVGGGMLKEYYRSFVPDRLRDRVIFEGFVPAADLPGYYRAADVFVSPAIAGESFGIVLLEAMASGLPVVASNIEGYNAVVTDRRDGFLVPRKNPLRLAERIIQIFRDDRLRDRLRTEGLQTAERYSWPRVTEQIERYYLECLQNSGKRA